MPRYSNHKSFLQSLEYYGIKHLKRVLVCECIRLHMSSMCRVMMRGHSITMQTDFCPFLTTYLLLVDKRRHLDYHLPFVYIDTLKMTTPCPRSINIYLLLLVVMRRLLYCNSYAIFAIFCLLYSNIGVITYLLYIPSYSESSLIESVS